MKNCIPHIWDERTDKSHTLLTLKVGFRWSNSRKMSHWIHSHGEMQVVNLGEYYKLCPHSVYAGTGDWTWETLYVVFIFGLEHRGSNSRKITNCDYVLSMMQVIKLGEHDTMCLHFAYEGGDKILGILYIVFKLGLGCRWSKLRAIKNCVEKLIIMQVMKIVER